MAAVWTGAGSYTLADGEMERMYREALDFDTELKTSEVLNEIEYSFVVGNSANNTAASIPASPSAAATYDSVTSQFNGLLEILMAATWSSGTAVTGYGNGSLINGTGAAYGGSGNLTEQMIKDAARTIAATNTPWRPDLLLVTAQQMEVINSFHPSIITLGSENLVGGASTDKYNTGFSTVTVAYEPQLPSGYAILTNTKLLRRAPLIELGAEPLARVQTQVERMITCEMSAEIRVQKAHSVIYNLAY